MTARKVAARSRRRIVRSVPPTERVDRAHAVLAGLVGAGPALVILLVARITGGPPGILETIADGIVVRIPPDLFEVGLRTFGTLAKGIFFAGVCGAFLAVGIGVAILAARFGLLIRRPAPAREVIVRGGLLAVMVLAISEIVVLPIADAGILGISLVSDPSAVHLPLIQATIVYGLLTSMAAHQAGPPVRTVQDAPLQARRTILGAGLIGVGALALGASAWSVAARALSGLGKNLPGSPDPGGAEGFGFTRAVTLASEFYFVSKDYVPLQVDVQTWRLRVGGSVDAPREYTIDDIQRLPAQEAFRTLQCISASSVQRADLIGNQRWKGVRLRDILNEVAPQASAAFVILHCADGYHESLPLDVAVADDTWLAYEMGSPGTPLPAEHGFPLRLLVAGRYGMKQPKYVSELVVADRDEPGWWVRGGWKTDAAVRTYCRIDLPAADGISDAVLAGHPFTAFGVASAGDRGISKVEVSLDGGGTWRPAEIEPLGGPIGSLTWVRWRLPVRFDVPGDVLFLARASDGRGTLQDSAIDDPFPRGASGYPRVPMQIYADVPAIPRSTSS